MRPRWVRAVLLLVWFAASFGVCWFARDLDAQIAGWPLNFWFAAQGGVLVFIALVMVYAAYMNGVERRALASQGADLAADATAADSRRPHHGT